MIEISAQNTLHLGDPQNDRRLVHARRDHIDDVANQFPAAGLQNHLRDEIAGQDGRFKIRSAFKAVGGVGMQAMPARHFADDPGIPPRRLDHDVPRFLGNHGVVAAHHSREPYRLFRVADDEVFRSELALDAVESFQRLAIAGLAHDNLPAFEQVHVEDVRWLPHFPENVVGGVDGI